jgi:RNA polymerase sigma factor (sigma-70 family)
VSSDPKALGSLPSLAAASRDERSRRIDDLVRKYAALVRSVVSRVGGPAVALVKEDVEQAVLISLWKQVEREQIIENPASYIYRAAVRETVRAVRRELARRPEPLEEGEGLTAAEDPFGAASAREQGDQIEACLAELGEEREHAVRAHLSGFDVEEIMERYGWTYQRARNLVARGMADLRAALTRRGVHG